MQNLYMMPFAVSYVESLCSEYVNYHLNNNESAEKMSNKQRVFLIFSLSMMFITNSLNWACFQRFSLGSYKATDDCQML